jgi:hypothetical protein
MRQELEAAPEACRCRSDKLQAAAPEGAVAASAARSSKGEQIIAECRIQHLVPDRENRPMAARANTATIDLVVAMMPVTLRRPQPPRGPDSQQEG